MIRMLQHYLTDDRFWAGITNYLTAHKYGNAETSQLWDSLQLQVPTTLPAWADYLQPTSIFRALLFLYIDSVLEYNIA